MATATGTGSYNTIKVVARFRPPNKAELAIGGDTIVEFEAEDTCNVNTKESQGAFTFDRVFNTASRQFDVFNFSIRSTVDDILNGYNGTVFAYGQTGSGKSYTMMGPDIDDEEQKGIIPRIVEQIFASILTSPNNIEYTVRVSYMEIYMERIRDLLQPQNDNLPVHEEKSRGVYVKGLLELYVSSIQDVYEIMRRGSNARAVAATNMNQESSRSHSIFVITITQKNVETGSARSGQLFLVDLAGSEKVGKTGASGQTLEEAKKINKSLSALGMVINSLTDGKSTHIPYRDSKLTRILQESLGGNSRTTLIINCSPSSYNAEETLGTLRFGVRAKAIKNKAKINAELSPAELKQLLKKAQSQIITYESYVANLEGELQLWRSGESVPRERWAPSLPSEGVNGIKMDHRPPRSGTPSYLQAESGRSEAPSRSDSRVGDRSSTPTVALDRDEREEFLRRENELQDQITEKESQVAAIQKTLLGAKDEIKFVRDTANQTSKDNERLGTELNELKMQIERVAFESKEATITMDSLKEANSELTNELDEVKQQLLDARIRVKESGAILGEKEKKKAERMAHMMAGFDMGSEMFSDNEKRVRECVEKVESLLSVSVAGEVVAPDDLRILKDQLLEAQGIVRQAELSLNQKADTVDACDRRREELEKQLAHAQRIYEEGLMKNLSDVDIEEVKSRLDKAFKSTREAQLDQIAKLRQELAHTVEENHSLKTNIEDLERCSKAPVMNGVNHYPVNGKTVQQQIADFDAMKKSLMHDLQNRCERVVELEISLDETREQYNNVLRSSNSRAQQKKMAFLERNLEQLTQIQRQLVEQNSGLKKEVAIAERKLTARNDRIISLNSMLGNSQEALLAANHKFEFQLMQVKDRLEAGRYGSAGALGPRSTDASAGFNFSGTGARIAKPLRGGGAGASAGGTDSPINYAVTNMQALEGNDGRGKRSSGFLYQRRGDPSS